MTTAATTGERRRLVRRLAELRGDDGCGDDGAALGCTVKGGDDDLDGGTPAPKGGDDWNDDDGDGAPGCTKDRRGDDEGAPRRTVASR